MATTAIRTLRWRRARGTLARTTRALRSRAFWMTLGGLAVLGPLVLTIWVDLPYLVYAVPPLVLGLWTWIFMLGLDRPRPVPRTPPEGTVVALHRRYLPREETDASRRAPAEAPSSLTARR